MALFLTWKINKYAVSVVEALGIGKYVERIFDRCDCVETRDGIMTKDLSIIGAPLQNIILIDVKIVFWGFHIFVSE